MIILCILLSQRFLVSSALDRLKSLTNKISSYERVRKDNLKILEELFFEVKIDDKVEKFNDIFDFKALNLSGASLQAENLGEIKEGKYLQILAISYDKDAVIKSKNVSLGYFGKVENVEAEFKDKIVEFIIRYRFEKSFMTLEHYNSMLDVFKKEEDE